MTMIVIMVHMHQYPPSHYAPTVANLFTLPLVARKSECGAPVEGGPF
jgi:hypothetical protein